MSVIASYRGEVLSWTEFAETQPDLAAAGRRSLYEFDIGLGFLATVRPDGGPRVHPVCPVINAEGLFVVITAGPKQRDLRRDGRYALHSETCPPPRHDDGFSVTGRAVERNQPDLREAIRRQLMTERKTDALWPAFDQDAIFELRIDGCLLMLTEADERFPAGPTIWRATAH